MDLDRIYAVAQRLRQRLHCSQQMAEYLASLLAWEHNVSEDSLQLLAEIRAIHSLRHHSAI